MNKEHPDPGSNKISSSSSSELTDWKLEEHQMATLRSCPSCGHKIDCNTDMIGMPAGVKFDPSDQELIHHLQTMVDNGGSRAHPLLDEFIPTIEGENGICYTHPENLPGVRRDGLSKHFFHRSSKAYSNGTRKRRKIHAQRDLKSSDNITEMRWHKTGKTRPVFVGARQKGCKKILVLYTNFGKHRKAEKTNWVMHQYHLGDKEERDGELVVSKVFYQTQTRQHVAAATTATAGQHMMEGEKPAETSMGMQDAFSAAANATSAALMMQQRQQQQMNQGHQADVQFSVAHYKKRCREGENHQQKQIDRMSAGMEELIKADSTQSETRQPYRYWPPDRNRDQHG